MRIPKITNGEFVKHCFGRPEVESNGKPTKIRSCGMKYGFVSEERAKYARSRMKSGRDLHSYRCIWCNLWHLGHDKNLLFR